MATNRSLTAVFILLIAAQACADVGPADQRSSLRETPSSPPGETPPTASIRDEAPKEGRGCTPSAPDESSGAATLDPDGVELKMPIDPNGSAWRLGAKDPNTDPEVVLRNAEGPVEKKDDYWTATSESAGKKATFRINVTVKASQGAQESNHAKLAERGYMVSPKDIRNLEMTGYFRVHGVADPEEAITMKVRGGQHTGDDDPRAACIGLLTEFTDADTRLWEKELFHPTTPRTQVNRLVTHGPLEDKWVGVKAIVYNLPGDEAAVSEAWIDTDPFDAAGKPKNQWKKVYEYVDEAPGFGGRPVTWGGKTETWRIDAVETIDFKLLSVHEIVPPAK